MKCCVFNSEKIKYYRTDEYGKKHRYVPVMIPDIVGEYLNVPNANSTTNNVAVQFDIFVGKTLESDLNTDEYENVGTVATFNAIEEFKNSLLAQYHPLGVPYLYMGGEDSTIDLNWTGVNSSKAYYFKFTPYNIDNETIYEEDTFTEERKLTKETVGTVTTVRWYYTSSNYISIDYTVNTEIELAVYHNGTAWIIIDSDGNTDSDTYAYTISASTDAVIGGTTGFEGLLKGFASDDVSISTFDFTSVTTEIEEWDIISTAWNSKDTLTNIGTLTLTDNTINNSILWSEDGNAIFGFGTLNPISDLRSPDGEALYQLFELEISAFISNDVLFGNNFEYYLDGLRVHPVDRSHTLSTEMGMAQYINGNYNTGIIEESVREHTLSFYYIPNKKLNSILKHVVSGDTAQNTSYSLLVQYPFFKETYNVLVNNGGTNPNINTLSTFTVTFTRKDTIITT